MAEKCLLAVCLETRLLAVVHCCRIMQWTGHLLNQVFIFFGGVENIYAFFIATEAWNHSSQREVQYPLTQQLSHHICKNLSSPIIAGESGARFTNDLTTVVWHILKMISNDFLVVKVNCWSYVFNIMKYMSILRNIKNKNIVEKNVWKCAPLICLPFASDDVISGKHNQTAYWVWMLTTDRATTHRHDDKM